MKNKQKKFIKTITVITLSALLLALCVSANAQQAKVYRVGVILQGGPFYTMVDGLRDGLKPLGLVEGEAVAIASSRYTG